MKQIQAVNVWFNGQNYEAKFLNAYVINDDLSTSATFWWGIYAESDVAGEPGQNVASANLTMGGEDYLNWNTNPNINEDAYIWIASQLGLTLI